MRYLHCLLALIVICCLGSCSGKGQGSAASLQPQPQGKPGSRSSSVEEVLAELEALPVPAGVDPSTFGELKSALAAVLSADADGKLVSRPPQGSANRITDLSSGISDEGLAGIQWNYRNSGDYDLNGEVNISDLTPIGQHFGKTSSSADWKSAARFADGDANGEVNISDITPIGANFFSMVAGYTIQSAPGPDGPFSDIDEILFFAGDVMLSGIRRFHLEVPEGDLSYRVVPKDLFGIPGEPSNPSQEFIISERTRVVGSPGGAQFAGRDGSNLTLSKPVDGSTIEPGDVVVGAEDGGYLIRALNVVDTGSELEVEGEPGILADVFLQGGLSEALSDLSQVPEEVYTLNLAGQVLVDDEAGGLRAEITSGSMTFLPQADVAVNYNQYGGVTYLRGLVLGGPLDLQMTVLLEADDWNGVFPPTAAQTAFYEHKMSGFEFDFVAYQNGVPVTMSLQYDVFVGIRGEGQLHGLYQAQVNSTYEDIRMGGIFNSAGIEDFNEYTPSHGTVPTPGISETGGTFRFTAYVRPEIHIKLYGNPVPGNSEDLALTLSPGLTLSAERTLVPPLGSNYTLEGAMDTSYLLELHHIGMDEDDQFKFFEGLPDLLNSGFIEDFEPPA